MIDGLAGEDALVAIIKNWGHIDEHNKNRITFLVWRLAGRRRGFAASPALRKREIGVLHYYVGRK